MKDKEYGHLLTPVDVKAILEKELEEREELTYEQKLTVSHVDRIKKISLKYSQGLIEELLKLERVTEYLAFKIAEIIPKDFDDVDMIYQRERFRLSDEEKEQILEITAKHS